MYLVPSPEDPQGLLCKAVGHHPCMTYETRVEDSGRIRVPYLDRLGIPFLVTDHCAGNGVHKVRDA